jgi:flagellar biosynthesis GTPase FlhF
MDLRVYYRKLREIEEGLGEEFVVLKSRATPDGGIAGRLTEAPRAVAARMILDGQAEAASEEDSEAFRRELAAAKQREDERQAAQIRIAMMTPSDFLAIQNAARGSPAEQDRR